MTLRLRDTKSYSRTLNRWSGWEPYPDLTLKIRWLYISGLVGGFPQWQHQAESFIRTLCRSVPRKKKPGGPQTNRPMGSLPSCGKLVGSPRFPWKMPGCPWFVFLGKEQVVKVWTATVWQGFSEHRYILGKGTWQRGGALRRSLGQGKMSEQGRHRIHKTSPGGLGRWEQLSNTQTILSSKSPCNLVSVISFGRWEHCASEARRPITRLTGSNDRQELRFQVHPSASNLRLCFALSPSLRFLEILR